METTNLARCMALDLALAANKPNLLMDMIRWMGSGVRVTMSVPSLKIVSFDFSSFFIYVSASLVSDKIATSVFYSFSFSFIANSSNRTRSEQQNSTTKCIETNTQIKMMVNRSNFKHQIYSRFVSTRILFLQFFFTQN